MVGICGRLGKRHARGLRARVGASRVSGGRSARPGGPATSCGGSGTDPAEGVSADGVAAGSASSRASRSSIAASSAAMSNPPSWPAAAAPARRTRAPRRFVAAPAGLPRRRVHECRRNLDEAGEQLSLRGIGRSHPGRLELLVGQVEVAPGIGREAARHGRLALLPPAGDGEPWRGRAGRRCGWAGGRRPRRTGWSGPRRCRRRPPPWARPQPPPWARRSAPPSRQLGQRSPPGDAARELVPPGDICLRPGASRARPGARRRAPGSRPGPSRCRGASRPTRRAAPPRPASGRSPPGCVPR